MGERCGAVRVEREQHPAGRHLAALAGAQAGEHGDGCRPPPANLMFVLDDLAGWEAGMTAELGRRALHGRWIRIHDSGDFFSVL
ncbi:hypothetical protein GCM10022225_84170 [Plantactinospora mayteni]|uniref:Gene product 88 domain-containing protein n=1 Tax=Plantactinospora mayteni TaxID=566021 RepID=A0ABQ4F4J7_9ACTN|nr:hypothetical protein Pma05_84180 [Plantactinospora mayteni]